MKKKPIIEHRITSRFEDEQREIFLEGYYSLKEAEIKKLEGCKIPDMSNQTTKIK